MRFEDVDDFVTSWNLDVKEEDAIFGEKSIEQIRIS